MKFITFGCLLLHFLAWSGADTIDTDNRTAGLILFPVPQFITVGAPNATCTLTSSFSIVAHQSDENDVLASAIDRYSPLIPTSSITAAQGIEVLRVSISDTSASIPTLDMDVSYVLTVGPKAATLEAKTTFGALYGLETFSQLVSSDGTIVGSAIVIKDEPKFRHRGLTIDVGRRWAPMELVKSIIDGLAFSKMNVLHISLSGPTVRVEMPDTFPELTAWMPNGTWYTQVQVVDLVEYARLRGVIIIPEIDIPAHASGFFPLAETHGLQFCDADRTTLSNDSVTMALVLKVFDEIVALFPSQIIHIGGDEALPRGACTFESIHSIELQVQRHLIDVHGRTPMGWNEVFSSPNETAPNGAIAGHTVLQNWKGSGDAVTIEAGFESVDSEYDLLYLNEQCCRVNPSNADGPSARFKKCFYVNPTEALSPDQQKQPDVVRLLQGAEAAMWSDEYCAAPLCAIDGTYGWMSDVKYDDAYVLSFGRQVFPKAAATGAGLWNYLNETMLPGDELARRLDAHNGRLKDRGVVTCPIGCNCDWGSSCGAPYANRSTAPKLTATIVNKTPFNVKVRAVLPCNKTNQGDQAVVPPGGNFTAKNDFMVLASVKGHSPQVLVGDPFDLWVGDSTWMDIQSEFHVTYDDSIPGNDYLTYTQIGISAAPEKAMHVSLQSLLPEGNKLYVKTRKKPVRTVCCLSVPNASCLLRLSEDWIAETRDAQGHALAQSDPFSLWWGDMSYLVANATLVVKQDKVPTYLDMDPKVWVLAPGTAE